MFYRLLAVFLFLVALLGMAYVLLNGNESKILASNPQSAKEVLLPQNPLSIEAVKAKNIDGGNINIEEELAPGINYKRYIASYKSDGLTLRGLLTIPTTEKPSDGYPAIIFGHGRYGSYISVDRQECIQEGQEGLIQAAAAFKPDFGTKFSSFAVHRIRGSMLDYMRRLDPISRTYRNNFNKVENAKWTYLQENGHNPSLEHLSRETGLTMDQISEAMVIGARSRGAPSIDDREDPDDSVTSVKHPPSDLGIPEEALERMIGMERILGIMEQIKTLSPREQEIVRMRYVLGLQFQEIGKRFNISQARATQIHKRILEELRRSGEGEG